MDGVKNEDKHNVRFAINRLNLLEFNFLKMKTLIEHLRQTRLNLLDFFEKHESKAHIIPVGFNNNLYWNFAHCIVTQQLLCYRLSNNNVLIDENLIEKYRKGTRPLDNIPSSLEISEVKEMAIKTVDQLELDYKEGLFNAYKAYATSYGIELNSIEDALSFNNIHEGLHLGYMMAIVK